MTYDEISYDERDEKEKKCAWILLPRGEMESLVTPRMNWP